MYIIPLNKILLAIDALKPTEEPENLPYSLEPEEPK